MKTIIFVVAVILVSLILVVVTFISPSQNNQQPNQPQTQEPSPTPEDADAQHNNPEFAQQEPEPRPEHEPQIGIIGFWRVADITATNPDITQEDIQEVMDELFREGAVVFEFREDYTGILHRMPSLTYPYTFPPWVEDNIHWVLTNSEQFPHIFYSNFADLNHYADTFDSNAASTEHSYNEYALPMGSIFNPFFTWSEDGKIILYDEELPFRYNGATIALSVYDGGHVYDGVYWVLERVQAPLTNNPAALIGLWEWAGAFDGTDMSLTTVFFYEFFENNTVRVGYLHDGVHPTEWTLSWKIEESRLVLSDLSGNQWTAVYRITNNMLTIFNDLLPLHIDNNGNLDSNTFVDLEFFMSVINSPAFNWRFAFSTIDSFRRVDEDRRPGGAAPSIEGRWASFWYANADEMMPSDGFLFFEFLADGTGRDFQGSYTGEWRTFNFTWAAENGRLRAQYDFNGFIDTIIMEYVLIDSTLWLIFTEDGFTDAFPLRRVDGQNGSGRWR